MKLHERLERIEDNALEILEEIDFAEIDDDLQHLEIVKGKKAIGAKLKPLVLALYFGSATIDHNDRSIYEKWTYPIYVLGLVVDKDPQRGRELSTILATEAREKLLSDRNLKKSVRDLKGTSFTPADERGQENLYSAGAGMEARFEHRP